MPSTLIAALQDGADRMAHVRRDLHAHPELSFEEARTSTLVADALQGWGIPVHRGLAVHGVVGILRQGSSARAIGLRADMDALPLQELNTFAHASAMPGRMHACGHDGHTAMLLAAAQYLAAHGGFDGTVYLIFQPAEESGGGARRMIADGLFDLFPMQAVFGLHNWPGLAAGQLAVAPGPVMAANGEFHLRIHGRGAHAGLPHTGIDPVLAGCAVVQAFQAIVSRHKDPTEAAALSVTMFQAGSAVNIIPDHADLRGTVRALSGEVMRDIAARLQSVADAVCAAHGATAVFGFVHGEPATVNAPAEAAVARQAMIDMVGEAGVVPQRPAMTSEDFAYMLQAVPGAYAFIGNGQPAGGVHGDHAHGGHEHAGPCGLHSPRYDFNDDILPVGAAYWVALARRALRTSETS